VAAPEQPLLVVLPEQHPVLRRRRDEQGGGDGSRDQGDVVHVPLGFGHPVDRLLEGDDEEEGEQELHAGQRHPEFVEQLQQLAIDPLLARLAVGRSSGGPAVAPGHGHPPPLPRGQVPRRRPGGHAHPGPPAHRTARGRVTCREVDVSTG